MTSQLKILAVNLATDAGTTVSDTPSASAGFPVTNLADARREYFAEFAATSVALEYTMVDKVLDTVFVTSTSLSASDTVRVQAYSDDAKTTLVWDSTVLPFVTATPWTGYLAAQNPQSIDYGTQYATNTFSVSNSSQVTVRKLVITITGSNPIRIGYVMFGAAWTFSDTTASFSFGAQLEEVDTSKHLRSAGGSLVTVPGHRYRKFTIPLDWLNDRDRVSLLGHLRYASKQLPIGISAYSSVSTLVKEDHSFVGKLSSDYNTVSTHAGNWRTRIVLEEG